MNRTAIRTASLAGLARLTPVRIAAFLLAVALCFGMVPSAAFAVGEGDEVTSPTVASADQAGTVEGTATLSIVYGMGYDGKPDVRLNKSYGFASGATLEDLFAAAKAAGDIKGYEFKDSGYGSYLESVEFADGAVAANAMGAQSLYWSTYKGGEYASGTDGQGTEALPDGASYQFAWESYPTAVAPDDWAPIIADAQAGSGVAGDSKPGNDSEPAPEFKPIALDSEAYNRMFHSLVSSFAGTADPWKALDLAAIGQASSVDTDALVAAVRASMGEPDPTALQKGVLALTAVGIDATSVVGTDGRNLVEAMATEPLATSMLNGRIFALLAYKSGPYEVPSTASAGERTLAASQAPATEQELLDQVLASQLASGGFALTGSSTDADMTAMVITALAPYQSDARVASAIESALAALKELQCADGGFPMSIRGGYEDHSNVNSTAVAVIALAALGIDPAASWTVEGGATPLSALLSFADEANGGFLYGSSVNDLATEQGFRAMVAYQGFRNTGAAYNVYLQAADGVAGLADMSAPESDSSSAGNALARTGDDIPVAGVLALSVCALVGVACALRKRTGDVRSTIAR